MTATSDPSPATAAPEPERGEHELLADSRVRALLEGYVSLSGATLLQTGEQRFDLDVPLADRAAFAGREHIRVVFSVEALQEDPGAEMAVVGSAFVDQLIAAVRSRGARLMLGVLPPDVPPDAAGARLQSPVVNGSAGDPVISLARHPVGRLTAKVTVRAGASVEEYLVDSGLFDLTTGIALDPDVAERCENHATGAADTGVTSPPAAVRPAQRPAAELVTLMLGDLETRVAADITRQGEEAARALEQELARIDGYYKTLLEDSATGRTASRAGAAPDADARRAVEAEHARRYDEEKRRHDVRAVVYPVQLKEWEVLAQRAEWPLLSRDGHRAALVGHRVLSGSGTWAIGCAHCGMRPPSALVVCYQGHAACEGCGFMCAVCDTGFCEAHGIAACHVDARPACGAHARSCASCRKPHCSAHESTCAEGAHPACSACVSACAHCGTMVCESHAVRTAATAPRGSRRLCASCVRYCEGGTSEPVGPDEVRRCASCAKVVCERHQATCAVDGQVHCSTHLRRTDRTRRLLCETHRGACAYEPEAIFAADELTECTTCRARGCATHIGVCAADATAHCTSHLAPLLDRQGSLGCVAHRTVCHVDGATYSLTGTWECPVCLKHTCASHLQPCASCGRSVCAAELERPIGKVCRTCRALQAVSDPDDRVVEASARLRGDRSTPKSWRTARDATHTVVELDHGWTRRTTFTLRHGDVAPDSAMAHSLLGTKRVEVSR